ncbi:MAG TPA: hypothetical protein VK841_17650 [Polyangiaceae bacterium]|nr:hypothetical protein [Polyangiaceae bacterium]
MTFAAGCRRPPTPGTTCGAAGETRCTAGDRAVVCQAGAWVEVPCKGNTGCAHREGADECDDTRAAPGDPCPPSPPVDYACTADARAALACKDGRFALWRHCRGKEGCSIAAGHHLNCDTTLGEPGDECEASGTYSCSTDGKQMLVCDGKALAITSSCGGANGCRFDRGEHKVDCDDSFAREGDRCDRPDRIACGPNGETELVCENGDAGAPVYTKKRECRRSACRVENADLYCD